MEANKPITVLEQKKDNAPLIKQDLSIITTNKSPNEHKKEELNNAKEKEIITSPPAIEKKKEKEFKPYEYQYEGYKHEKYSGNM